MKNKEIQALTQTALSIDTGQAHTFAQTGTNNVRQRPCNAIPLSILQTFENALQSKQLLSQTESDSFNPLWFLAQTERNIYLWRKSFSLVQADEFSFWVDIRKLISKRLHQLKQFTPDNPFINPLWSLSVIDEHHCQLEQSYLLDWLELYEKAAADLQALCCVAEQLTDEILQDESPHPYVVLPAYFEQH